MMHPYIIVLSLEDSKAEKEAVSFIKNNTKKCIIKSKTTRKGLVELNAEVSLSGDNTDFINELTDKPGVNSAVLVSFNGDYQG